MTWQQGLDQIAQLLPNVFLSALEINPAGRPRQISAACLPTDVTEVLAWKPVAQLSLMVPG